MTITSLSWFFLLFLANLAVVASSGAVALDAIAILLIGYSLIRIRTGKEWAPIAPSLSPLAQFVQHEAMSFKQVKASGLILMLSLALMLQPFSWGGLLSFLFSVLTIELVSAVLLECSLRDRLLGNLSIVVMLGLCFWSIQVCSNVIVSFLLGEAVPGQRTSWTGVFDHISFPFFALLGAVAILLIILRLRPKRDAALVRPRLWLFG